MKKMKLREYKEFIQDQGNTCCKLQCWNSTWLAHPNHGTLLCYLSRKRLSYDAIEFQPASVPSQCWPCHQMTQDMWNTRYSTYCITDAQSMVPTSQETPAWTQTLEVFQGPYRECCWYQHPRIVHLQTSMLKSQSHQEKATSFNEHHSTLKPPHRRPCSKHIEYINTLSPPTNYGSGTTD
jgi:hypothetical protein